MSRQLISDEKLVSINKAQAGLTRILRDAATSGNFYRVIKNDESLGVLLPQRMWESITEDIEALSSPTYRARIAKARTDKKTIKSAQVKRQLGL